MESELVRPSPQAFTECIHIDIAAGQGQKKFGSTLVDLLGEVVPGVCNERLGPLGDATYAPLESSEVRANADFDLGKVRLEEVELML